MPLLRFVAENIGPFDRLDLDLSDGHGRPHLGPHILAGVNGSGKTTVLRTLAWSLGNSGTMTGFPDEEWRHSQRSGFRSSVVSTAGGRSCHWGSKELATEMTLGARYDPGGSPFSPPHGQPRYIAACYEPGVRLQYLGSLPPLGAQNHWQVGALSFNSTVRNAELQAWLVALFSQRALAEQQGLPTEYYTRVLTQLEHCLSELYGTDARLTVEIKKLTPMLQLGPQVLNFSQIAAGVSSSLGWIADFLMRLDSADWAPDLNGARPGVVMVDEIDLHLHPLWQRRILPAVRKALPEAQLIVTSHSPFVISSCSSARVHVLEIDSLGKARVRESIDAPVGESLNSVLVDIFGVKSRFDVQTEDELNEWDGLARIKHFGKLNGAQSRRFRDLTKILSARSEELRSIVGGANGSKPGAIR
jgi:hypothetical protein